MSHKSDTTPRRTTTIRTVQRRRKIIQYVTVEKEIQQCELPYVLFGQAVVELRKKLGMTQQDLADKMKYSRGSIANIETGRQRINISDLYEFAEVLKICPKKLFLRTAP